MSENSILLSIMLVPFIGAMIVVSCRLSWLRDVIGLSIAVLLFALVVRAYPLVSEVGTANYVLFTIVPNIDIAFQIEPLGWLFSLVASSLFLITMIYGISYMRANGEKHLNRFFCFFSIAIAATMGIALSANLITLFLFYEILTISTYPLVTHKGTKEAASGGRLYLLILMGTSIAFFLPAIVCTYVITGTLDFSPSGILHNYIDNPLSQLSIICLLMLFAYGIGKAALVPIQAWLPAAMVAPTPVSALLHAVAVVKAGVFCMVKIITYIFGIDLLASHGSAEILVYVSGASILIASYLALKQNNLKKRLAYSTVSQLSYITLAISMVSSISATAAAMHITAHAVGKIVLFFTAGAIYTAAHKTEINQLNGIGRRMPWTMVAFTIAALSMIGLPPTVGFTSKWFIFSAAIDQQQWFALAVLTTSTLLTAAYLWPVVYRAFFMREELRENSDQHGEAPWPMVTAMTFLVILNIGLFCWPNFILEIGDAIYTRGR